MNDEATIRPARGYTLVCMIGSSVIGTLEYIGGLANLLAGVLWWLWCSLVLRRVRFGWPALYGQLVRVGGRSVGIICLVSACIGLIMVLQMAPPLEQFNMVNEVATINSVAVLRELGPLISAIVLTGFAGASIAAELGTMVVGEEIEALESMALNPVRFLVVPRVLATIVAMLVLASLADVMAIGCGAMFGVGGLQIPWGEYYDNMLKPVDATDFLTGVFKAGVFGALIGLIACFNGLRVSGGAAGVGRATTLTVVHAIVSIIFADLLFTATFYVLGWN